MRRKSASNTAAFSTSSQNRVSFKCETNVHACSLERCFRLGGRTLTRQPRSPSVHRTPTPLPSSNIPTSTVDKQCAPIASVSRTQIQSDSVLEALSRRSVPVAEKVSRWLSCSEDNDIRVSNDQGDPSRRTIRT